MGVSLDLLNILLKKASSFICIIVKNPNKQLPTKKKKNKKFDRFSEPLQSVDESWKHSKKSIAFEWLTDSSKVDLVPFGSESNYSITSFPNIFFFMA
uniref:Uncharacterized protein n=1 Tax=Daphnia magna TaxID=35525 RepID=A0A0P5R4G7_9CRUS